MAGVAVTDAENTFILSMARKGYSTDHIAARLGLGHHVVYRIARGAGLLRGARSRGADRPTAKLNDDKVLELRTLRLGGATYRQLGERYGVSTVAAWKACNGWWTHVEDPAEEAEA